MTKARALFFGPKCRYVLIALGSITVFSIALALTAKANESSTGEQIYMRGCIACHGADGSGAMPGIQPFSGELSPLRKPDKELIDSILNGVDGKAGAMPPKGGDDTISESDARSVLLFLREKFRTRIPANN